MTTVAARPDFLTAENAARFADADVAEAYPHRAPYAPETVDVLIALLTGRGPFAPAGEWRSDPVRARQSVDDYVESDHSRSSLTRAALGPERAASFGAAVRAAVAPWAVDGHVEIEAISHITWGHPAGGRA